MGAAVAGVFFLAGAFFLVLVVFFFVLVFFLVGVVDSAVVDAGASAIGAAKVLPTKPTAAKSAVAVMRKRLIMAGTVFLLVGLW